MDVTLFERIGGTNAIARLVDTFYERVLEDPTLAPFFKGVEMTKLRRMQLELFSAALEGPVRYTGRPMIQAHRHLNIGLHHYQRFVRHLFDTLSDAGFELSEQERYEVIGRLNLLTDEVMSAGTGLVG
jgi:hemoglobin